MNHKEYSFSELDLPKVQQNQEYKKRLREALLLAHQERSTVRMFSYAINDHPKTMSTLQKSFAFSALAVAGLVVAAGTFGPSAYSVAHAQAQETIQRTFVHLASLSDEERAALEERFQDGLHFKVEAHGKFIGFKDLSPEELEVRHAEMQASLTATLAEAQAASDLRIVGADELPVSGFLGKAGRTFGFKMTKHHEGLEERFANLPEDIRQNFTVETTPDGKTIYRHSIEDQADGERMIMRTDSHMKVMHSELSREKMPVSFMVYTNADDQTVYLGINANDEPVVKFVQSKEGTSPLSPHGGRMLFKSESTEE